MENEEESERPGELTIDETPWATSYGPAPEVKPAHKEPITSADLKIRQANATRSTSTQWDLAPY